MGKTKNPKNPQQSKRISWQEFQRMSGLAHTTSFPDIQNPHVQQVQQQLDRLSIKRSMSEQKFSRVPSTPSLISDSDQSDVGRMESPDLLASPSMNNLNSPNSIKVGRRNSLSVPPLALCCGHNLLSSGSGTRYLYNCRLYVRLSRNCSFLDIDTLVSRVTFRFKETPNRPLEITVAPFEVDHAMTVGTLCEISVEFKDLASSAKYSFNYKIDTNGAKSNEEQHTLHMDTFCVQAMILKERDDKVDESNCSDWSINEVVLWAALQGLGKYSENIRKMQIDGQKLVHFVSHEVAKNDLKMKSQLDRDRLMSGISRLRKFSSSKNSEHKDINIDIVEKLSQNHESESRVVREVRTDWKIGFQDIVLGDSLGSGSYGRVYKGSWKNTDVAIKEFFSESQDLDPSPDQVQLAQEVYILQQLRHPSICDYYGVCQHEGRIYMVMKLYPISLYKFLRARKRSNEYLAPSILLQIAQDIAEGMDYLHTISVEGFGPIIHRDLKSPNILLELANNRHRARICDFGLATIKKTSQKINTDRGRGTAGWCAPEILSRGEYDESCDIWSFGVCLWEMASLKEPYEELGVWQISVGIEKGDGFIFSHLNKAACCLGGKFPEEAKIVKDEIYGVIKKCLEYRSSDRPRFKDIIQILSAILDSYLKSVKGRHQIGNADGD